VVFGLCEWNTAGAAHEAQLVVLGDAVDVDVGEVARRAAANARGFLPRNIVVTNMQPEPNNFAGATVAAYNGVKTTPPGPIVLVEQGGHWLITHDTAKTSLDAFWHNSNRRFVSGNSI
jgi:hypothetical protein